MDLEGMYRDIVESSPDGIWVLDLTGRTLYANATLARMYGVTAEEMGEVTVFDTLDDHGRDQFRAHLDAVRAGEVVDEAQECLFHSKDGTARWILVQESFRRDEHGAPTAIVHRILDYDRRRETTKALEESRAQLAEAQRIARMGGWTWDVEADVIEGSDEYIETFGFDKGFFPCDLATFTGIIHEDDHEALAAETDRMMRTGAPFELTIRVGDEESGWTWAKARGVGRRGPDGRVVRVEGTLQDVTETVLQEQALRDQVMQDRLLQAVATAANEASTLDEVLGQSKHLVLLHDDWRRARGFHHRDALVPIYLDDEDRQADVDDPALLESDLRLAREVVRTGDLTWDEARLTIAFPVMVRHELFAVLAIESDPPLYRHDMIESFVRQVAAQLSEVALREEAARQMEAARDAAVAASRQKSDFLAMVSHEIRTPLNGVIGLNELLLQTALDDEQRKLATGAGLSGRLLLSLINDILDFSKIEAGQLRLERVDFHLRGVFDQLLDAQVETAEQKGVTLLAEYDPALPDVLRGDPTRVSQVVNNLVSNAVKFTDRGAVVVRLSATRDGDGDEAGDWLLRCEVEDTGIGIDPAVEGLFEPFQQADTSTSRRFGGTGLGLAISRELVALAHGEIGYHSILGRGSTFWFTMRMEAASGGTALGRPVAPSLQAQGPSRRVLLVEDNAVNRMVAAGMLQALGHQADTAEDGVVALDLLQTQEYDAVLLDVQMPRMDGYATARAIRERESRGGAPRLPIIALTAAAVDGERERCLQAGMDDFLTKPIEPQGLAAALRRWTRREAADSPNGCEDQPRQGRTRDAQNGSRTSARVLDLERIRMLRDLVPGSTAYLDGAIDNFLNGSVAVESTLRQAVADGDAEVLAFKAHSLKGSAGNLGLVGVAEVAELLQRIGDSGDLEDAQGLLGRLSVLLDEGREALRTQRATGYTDLARA